ncbi:MAG: hypothetical protein JWP88_847 [Flaviaesturariibacter sp.]|nr:hypothetical protein [Flaviaesturariibacter sp.]
MKGIYNSLLCLLLLAIPFACRKFDSAPSPDVDSKKERFFLLPATASAQVKAVAASVWRQNEQQHFLENVIKRSGYPRWDKARLINLRLGGFVSKVSDLAEEEIIYVPFIKDSQNFVNALLAVKMNATDTIFRMLHANGYRSFGYDTTNATKWSTRDVFNLFTSFDYTVFGHTRFLIRDPKIFSTSIDSMQMIAIRNMNQSRMATAQRTADELSCVVWTYCYVPPSSNNRLSVLANPCTEVTVCTAYIDYNILNPIGGGGVTGTGGGTGGGGNNGGGSSWTADPCGGSGVQARITECGGPTGWVPIDKPPINTGIIPPDSIKLKNMYLQIQDSVNKYYAVSNAIHAEYSLTITEKDSINYARNAHTDNQQDYVYPDLSSIPIGEKITAIWHAHWGEISFSNMDLSFSNGDIVYPLKRPQVKFNGFTSFITSKNFIYAYVITDVTKYDNWLKGHGTTADNRLVILYNFGQTSCQSCSNPQMSEKSALFMCGTDSNVSGIKLYKSPTNNILFTSLN